MSDSIETSVDRELSFQILLQLATGFQGTHVASEILVNLEHPSRPEKTLGLAARVLEKVNGWFIPFLEGKADLFVESKWSAPQTEDARLAWQLLDSLRLELKEVAELSQMILGCAPSELSSAEVAWCVAQHGRFIYTARDNYQITCIFSELTKDQERFERSRAGLENLQPDIAHVATMVEWVYQGGERGDVRTHVMEAVRGIPRKANLALHYLNFYYYCFKPAYTYEMFGIPAEEAVEWYNAGFDPLPASFWRSCGVRTGQEALAWFNAGWESPIIASYWNDSRVRVEEAIVWRDLGIEVAVAREWRRAGFSPERAIDYIRKGMTVPPIRPRS